MDPELLNNSLFVRYYNQWLENPASIVFAPLAEFFLDVGKTDEAVRLCLEGLNHHPEFVSGRLVLAKAFLQKREYGRAKVELKRVLDKIPNQERAKALLNQIGAQEEEKIAPKPAQAWQTLTMAKIFVAQGHFDQAREVYQSILAHDPGNEEAKQGLTRLQNGG